MTDLDKQLRDLTVGISCKHCSRTYEVRLTGFGGTYICECGQAIKTTKSLNIFICKKTLSST